MKSFFNKKTLAKSIYMLVFFGFFLVVSPINARAQIPAGCPGGPAGPPAPGTVCPASSKEDCKGEKLTVQNCGIVAYLVTAIRILSGLVGITVVIVIAYGGVQYALARDNPQAVASAKSRIINAIIALVVYLAMFGFLQWLVPGGII